MNDVDKRNRLADEVFTYHATKDGKVLIAWHGKHITTLKGEQARKLLRQIDNTDHHQTQLALAKATGHFKHGNER
jgi:hypothetical protein